MRRSHPMHLLLCCLLAGVVPGAARAEADHCGLEPPGSPAWDPVPARPFESHLTDPPPLVRRDPGAVAAILRPWDRGAGRGGALSGKTVYLSPGHGFTYESPVWRTQRGLTNGIVEDLASAEGVHQLLLRYLQQAGARVVTVREPDLNQALAIVDDGDGPGGGYVESGPASRFGDSAQPGWGRYAPPLTGQQNPFALGRNRLLTTAAAADAWAAYTPDVPQDGAYNVYVSYSQHASRAADAHYVVRHAGGEEHLRVDQRRHGGTWILLGRFFFRKGRSGSVTLQNDSATPGASVSLDAVRLGGGLGDIDRGSGVSGRPRWEESARYYTQYTGAPAAVYDQPTLLDHDDDVGARSRFAAWDHEDGEDAVYLAWHTNAPNPGVGTSSYVYGPNPPDGTYNFTGVAGSDVMMRLVHDEIVGDLRKGWDPTWRDRGKYTAYFGEVNPRHNPETPAALIEVAFHDTPSDALQLKQAGFRRIVARAMYQGLARYFAQKDGTPVALLPEPPLAACAQGVGPGAVQVRWRPPAPDVAGLGGDPPTRYRVYRSADGRAFDGGTEVTSARLTITDLAPGQAVYLRVTAVNDGGESFGTSVVAARPRADGARARVLLVGGFDRLDGGMLVQQDLTAYGLGLTGRMLLDAMNDGSYLAQHGRALSAADVSFDSCERQALSGPDAVALGAYALIDWQAGENSQSPRALSAAERAALMQHQGAGGRLILSGSELFWALAEKGSDDERQFVRGLGVSFLEDDAQVHVARPMPLSLLDGLPDVPFDDGSHGIYRVHTPDVLAALPPARLAMIYKDGAGAMVVNQPDRPTAISVGFPLETIYDEALRAQVFARLLGALGVPADPLPMPPPSPGDLGAGPDLSSPMPEGGCACQLGRAGAGDSRGASCGALLIALGLLASRRRRTFRATLRS